MRWECKTLHIKLKSSFFGGKLNTNEQDEVLNKHGHLGWELVNCYNHRTLEGCSWSIAVMKKPVS